jgi:hypothetical protein
MISPCATDQLSCLESQFERRRFSRRTDLTPTIRLKIATDALYSKMNAVWGTITDLASKYRVSRPFVYSLADKLKEAWQFLFTETTDLVSTFSPRLLSIQIILSLRFEACSSIGAISTVMHRFWHELSSTGSISQKLSRIGALLPTTLGTENGVVRYLVFASDEIFSKSVPVLVTVDPCSSAILRIEVTSSRKADDWKKHFDCLYDNGIEPLYLVSDEGQGIGAGHAEAMSAVVRQSDTYHAIAHQLGSWVDRLEKAAYKAIGVAHECEMKLDSAKSAQALEKRLADCEESAAIAERAVRLYDDFSYLYRCVVRELNVFDSNGNLRDRHQAEEGLKVGVALMEELHHSKITEAVNKIKRTLPNLFHYFDIAKQVIHECSKLPVDGESLKAYCIAWQWGKAIRKSKQSERKKKLRSASNSAWKSLRVCISRSRMTFRTRSIPCWIESSRVQRWSSVSIQLSGPT